MVRQAELIRQAQDGDKKARDKVVSDNLGLVHAIVRRFEKRGHDREELFQIGCIGLIKAIDHFDLSLNLAFSTYAVPMITGQSLRFHRLCIPLDVQTFHIRCSAHLKYLTRFFYFHSFYSLSYLLLSACCINLVPFIML